jgi:hypothetical protein
MAIIRLPVPVPRPWIRQAPAKRPNEPQLIYRPSLSRGIRGLL